MNCPESSEIAHEDRLKMENALLERKTAGAHIISVISRRVRGIGRD